MDMIKGGSNACAGAVTLDAGTYPSSQVEYLWNNLTKRPYLASEILCADILTASDALAEHKKGVPCRTPVAW